MKLCAHLGFQFNEFEGLERIRQAALAGYTAAEWPAIYGFKQADFVAAVYTHQLAWPQVTLPTGDAVKGEKGITALTGREAEFAAGLELAIDYAKKLGSEFIHPMSGVADLSDSATRGTYIANLKHAAQRAERAGLKVLVEVISPATVPGYAMNSYALASEVFEAVPGLYLLLDTYHAAVLEGDVCAVIERFAGRIGHVQIADLPGRHEPGTGRLDFAAIKAALKKAGYDSWLGCEYKPQTTTLAGVQSLREQGWF